MRNKPTWKPAGLKAKKWRTPNQTRGASALLPTHVSMQRRKKSHERPPFEHAIP